MLNNLVIGTIVLNLLALTFVFMRAKAYRTTVYRPMVLNVGLSILPIFVLILALGAALFLSTFSASNPPWFLLWPGYFGVALLWLAWLLMLPNASYLITELNFSHRKSDDVVPLWFDIILVLTLAMSGVFNMVINIALTQIFYAAIKFSDLNTWVALREPQAVALSGIIIILCSFGMYLGRYLRLNSWDIKHPIGFIKRLAKHFDSLATVRNACGFILAHSAFIGLVYYIIFGGVITAGIMIDNARMGF